MPTKPLIGRTVYNRQLDNIRNQTGITLEAINQILAQDEMQERTLITALNTITQAQISIADSVALLERFGISIKETGELDAELLKGREE